MPQWVLDLSVKIAWANGGWQDKQDFWFPQASWRCRRERKGEFTMVQRGKKPTSHVRSWIGV